MAVTTRRPGRRRALLAVAAVVALGLPGCAQLDLRLLAAVPRSADAAALPRASDSPGADPSASASPTTEPTTATPTGSATPSGTSPTAEPTASVSPDASASASASETTEPSEPASPSSASNGDEGSGLPTWIPLVALGGIALGAVLLLAGRSRTRRWDDLLGIELGQAQWVLDELLPAMTNPAAPPADLVSHWSGAQTTLDQLQGGLAALIADAPDAERAASAQALAGGVAEVRQAVAADLGLRTAGSVDPMAAPASAARVAAARERLAVALARVA